jgi:hypothetical protein
MPDFADADHLDDVGSQIAGDPFDPANFVKFCHASTSGAQFRSSGTSAISGAHELSGWRRLVVRIVPQMQLRRLLHVPERCRFPSRPTLFKMIAVTFLVEKRQRLLVDTSVL